MLIDRDKAIEAIDEVRDLISVNAYCAITERLKELPSAQRRGKWILVKGSNGKDYHKCSECLHTQEITGVKNYCAVCGARMEGTE